MALSSPQPRRCGHVNASGPTPTTAPDVSPTMPIVISPVRESFWRRCGAGFRSFWKGCVRSKANFLEKVEHWYEKFGHSLYDHPWPYMIWPIIICTLLSYGLLWRETELDMVKLYGLPGCKPHVALEHLQGIFPIERIEYVFAVSRGGLLTREKLTMLDQMWTKIKRLRVPKYLTDKASVPGETGVITEWLRQNDPATITFEEDWSPDAPTPPADDDFVTLDDVCVYDGFGTCKMTGVLDLYNSRRMFGQPLRTREWPQYINLRSQRAYRVDSMLGEIALNERPGGATEVVNATSAAFRIDLDGTEELIPWASTWEQGLLSIIQNMHLPDIELHGKAERSLSDELALSSQLRGDDLMMLLIAAVLVSVFTCAINSSTDPYRSKLVPALVGVATTLFSYGGGVGLCHLLGMPHVPPSEATPFIVLAINVDDVFVITNAYSMTYLHSHCARSRMGMALRDAGVSITLTTVTNIIAFGIGASSVYYSIQIFCVVTATALLVGFLLSLFVFGGALAISARLEQEKRPCSILANIRVQSAVLAAMPLKGTPASSIEMSAPRTVQARRPSLTAAGCGGTLGVPDAANLGGAPSSQPVPGVGGAAGISVHPSQMPTYPVAETSVLATLTPGADAAISSARELTKPTVSIRCRSPSPVPARYSRRPSLAGAASDAITRTRNGEMDSGRVRTAVSTRRGSYPTGTPAATEGGQPGYYLVEDLSNQYVITRRVEEYLLLASKDRGASAAPATAAAGGVVIPESPPMLQVPRTYEAAPPPFPSGPLEDSGMQQPPPPPPLSDSPVPARESEIVASSPFNKYEAVVGGGSGLAWPSEALKKAGGGAGVPACSPSAASGFSSIDLANRRVQSTTTQPRDYFEEDDDDNEQQYYRSGDRNGFPTRLDIDKLPKLVWIDGALYPAAAVNLREPKGTVGGFFRDLFLRYLGCFLVLRPVKMAIFLFFGGLFVYNAWCSTHVTAGIRMKDVAPMDSYFRDVIKIRESDYAAYGEECLVFFRKGGRWWDPAVQSELLQLTREIRDDPHVVFVMSGVEDFLLSAFHNETSGHLPTDRERKLAFTRDWESWVSSPRGKNFGKFFLRDYDGTPSVMKFYYWMEYTDNSEVSQKWMLKIQDLLESHDQAGLLLGGEVFTPLALLWESDPVIFGATMWNMVVAMSSMGLLALILIPDMLSGALVVMVILMIYCNVYGFMYLWDLPLNMLTMVNLVLAIGFAVDYTAHITHTFNHCRGTTRNARVIETVVMMGLPITNGMLSTYVAIAALSMSRKYTLIVIFKMTTTIIASAFAHGLFFMPVLLSVVGPLHEREVTVVKVMDGAVQDSWTVDLQAKRPLTSCGRDSLKLKDDLRRFSRWGVLSQKGYVA